MMYQHIAYIVLGLGFLALFIGSAFLFPSQPAPAQQAAASVQIITPPAPALPSNESINIQ